MIPYVISKPVFYPYPHKQEPVEPGDARRFWTQESIKKINKGQKLQKRQCRVMFFFALHFYLMRSIYL
jgi:hypothetical protein